MAVRFPSVSTVATTRSLVSAKSRNVSVPVPAPLTLPARTELWSLMDSARVVVPSIAVPTVVVAIVEALGTAAAVAAVGTADAVG